MTGPLSQLKSSTKFGAEKENEKDKDALIANENIRYPQVRLVGAAGEQIGIVDTKFALYKARQAGLDLLLITEKATPPVAKIIDLGKYKYEKSKRDKEIDKKNRAAEIETKQIQFRPTTNEHDIIIKAKQIQGFINDGNKVKILVKLRGRESSHESIALDVISAVLSKLTDFSNETAIERSEKSISVIIKKTPVK